MKKWIVTDTLQHQHTQNNNTFGLSKADGMVTLKSVSSLKASKKRNSRCWTHLPADVNGQKHTHPLNEQIRLDRKIHQGLHPVLDSCYVSVTMSTWSPSPIITTIITPIWDANNCLSPLSSLRHFPKPLPSHSQGHTTLSSLPLAYLMSTLFRNHQWISPWTLYSTIGPLTGVSGYRHAWNDLLLLSHVYSMSQILLVVYSSYTSLYFPSFESQLSSSNLFSELSLSFVFATHNLPISFSEI